MATLEEQFQQATEAGDLPGVVLLASDTKGNFSYQKAIGPKSATEKIGLDSTFILASCTKIMTAIAAWQCVERGQIGLDDDVSEILTELKNIQILTGFKEGTEEGIYEKAKNKVSLRHLLTHTSGFAYDRMDPNLLRWRASRGEEAGPNGMPMMKRIATPLVFEPGTNFSYGTSLDWAGVLIARLNNKSLEAYMEENIWGPLGIKNMTFHQELKPDVKKNLVTMAKREDGEVLGVALKDSGAKIFWTDEKVYDDPTEDEWGGAGGIGSAVEFIKILNSINADDGKLLKSETINLMFTPQLSDNARVGFEAFVGFAAAYEMFTSHEPGTKLDYGIGGMLVLSDKETGLKSGTLSWSGLPTLLWTIDRKSGLSLFYASNLVPFGDQKSHKMQQLFEKEMYTRYSKHTKL